jgi:hypothetical protein
MRIEARLAVIRTGKNFKEPSPALSPANNAGEGSESGTENNLSRGYKLFRYQMPGMKDSVSCR